MKMKQHILAIDPSINQIGWALLELPYQEYSLTSLEAGWKFSTFNLRGEGLQDKIRHLDVWLRRMMFSNPVIYLVGEMPTFFNSEKGRIAARMNWTIQLGVLLGFIMARLECEARYTFYTPAQWKGTMTKEVTKKRFLRTFTDATNWKWIDADHNTIDAIMLLHYWVSQRREKLSSPAASPSLF